VDIKIQVVILYHFFLAHMLDGFKSSPFQNLEVNADIGQPIMIGALLAFLQPHETNPRWERLS
jgi:hypothetical protein